MKKARWISAAIGTAVLTAGFVLPAGAAFASGPSGNGNSGLLSVLSGNDATAPLSVPINVCGVAVALLGGSNAGCQGGASSNTIANGTNGGSFDGNAGLISAGSGNNLTAPITAPLNVCGVAVGGVATSGCKGGSHSNTIINGGTGGDFNGNAGGISAVSGNSLTAPVSIPVNLCGISVALVGFSNAACQGGSFSNTLINP
jgi:ChpA-C